MPGIGAPQDSAAKLHAWRIEDREYARHEARRGRRFAFPSFAPTRTALVIIDMVPFFVTGNPYCRGIVPNIDRLAQVLRAAGGTVAWVLPAVTERTSAAEEFYGPDAEEAFRTAGGTGALAERVWREFTIHDDDVLVEKSAPSAFFPGRCALPELLTRRGIDTVLITGTVTNVAANPRPPTRAPWASA
ncbi:isochorismatase family protein [Saccharopolyspora pogona]|uniref:isochorismatase family protein n=1 Tax=Saccharopolyspora pogona TaxID=333966 RepID=UPI001CC2385E|nr:isochorismatase family protein [Saccharopolyspora pogona]